MKKKVMVVWLLCCAIYAVVADDTMMTGLDAYSRGDWDAAIAAFEQAAETQPENRTEILYWLVMAETSAQQYPRALSYADAFLAVASGDERAAEVRYQKGRILHLSGSYQDSSEVMYQFINDYPYHPKVPSAYYWIGENLYAEGSYTDARKVFAALVLDYPISGKVNEARYKIMLIDQQAIRGELTHIVREVQEQKEALPDTQNSAAGTTDAEAAAALEETQRQDEEIADRLKTLEEKIDALAESLSKIVAEQESLREQEQQAELERQQREQEEKDRIAQEQQEKQKQEAEARLKELEELRQQSRALEQLYKQRTKGGQ